MSEYYHSDSICINYMLLHMVCCAPYIKGKLILHDKEVLLQVDYGKPIYHVSN